MRNYEAKIKARMEIEKFKNNLQGIRCMSGFSSISFNTSNKKLKVDKDYSQFKRDMVIKNKKKKEFGDENTSKY